MTQKATDNSFESFNSGVNPEPQIEVIDHGTVPPYLLDSERVSLYLTLAGLLDAGVNIDTALTLFETESKAQKQKHNADRVSEFFRVARAARDDVKSCETIAARTDIIGETAEKCFGKNFTSPEELVLLRGLAHTDNISAILRASANIIRSRHSHFSPIRPSAGTGRRSTF
jgi:hypothetical protein